MGYWKQDKPFNLAKMGTTKNYCLHNVRLAFGIGPKYASAKLAMKENQDKGTLHSLSSAPKNVAVPIFTSAGVWGHVMVCDRGVYYSDGRKVAQPNASEYKWGELLNGVRVVSWVESKPAKKTNEQIADEVIAGKWGNGADRKRRLEAAGYDYGAIQRIVDQKLKPKPAAIKVGDTVIVSGQGTGNSKGGGGKTKNYAGRKMKVIQIANGRYACNQYNQQGAVTGWWTASQIRKA